MKVFVETLGCKVNTYEGEVIKSLFINNGEIGRASCRERV